MSLILRPVKQLNKKARFTFDKPVTWTRDGEDGGTHQVAEIEAIHNAYRIVHGDGAVERQGK